MVKTKIPSETREESWKFLWRRQRLARKEREVKQAHQKRERKMTKRTRFQRHNMLVFWTLMTPRDNVSNHLYQNIMTMARVMESPRQVVNRRRRTREGPEPACVRSPFDAGVAHAGGEGRINVLPLYRPVGVAKTSSETQEKHGRPAWPQG